MDEGRRLSLKKYNCSAKRKAVSKRYREAHKEQCYKWSKEWADKNRERVNRLRRDRYKTPEGKAIRDAISKRYYRKNRIKRFAKDKANNAVRAGKLLKPDRCEICNIKTDKLEKHHPNYLEPLKIVWVCKKCHTEVKCS